MNDIILYIGIVLMGLLCAFMCYFLGYCIGKNKIYDKDKINQDESEFTIKVSMKNRWVPQFLSFLKRMEFNGMAGHSEIIGFYSDGDGDFRPKFEFRDLDFEEVESKSTTDTINYYDAG